jgi:hypothetical protein
MFLRAKFPLRPCLGLAISFQRRFVLFLFGYGHSNKFSQGTGTQLAVLVTLARYSSLATYHMLFPKASRDVFSGPTALVGKSVRSDTRYILKKIRRCKVVILKIFPRWLRRDN